jgi:ribosomal protein S18 acetylase RimI-like enzyme
LTIQSSCHACDDEQRGNRDGHVAKISIGDATPADEKAIKEVSVLATASLREIYRPENTVLVASCSRTVQRTRRVARIHERVVGTVQYTCEGDRIHLIGLLVHPQFQRQGVARALVEDVAQIGQRQGMRCLSLYTVKETGNVPIFAKLGFESITERIALDVESDRYETLTDVYMEKSLG